MRAIQLPGHGHKNWFLEFDGDTYGPFATAEEALAFDDREMTEAEAAKYRIAKLEE